jgi:hypothetical protein
MLTLSFFSFVFLGTCAEPMGAGWDFKLPDSAFTASSTLKSGIGFTLII